MLCMSCIGVSITTAGARWLPLHVLSIVLGRAKISYLSISYHSMHDSHLSQIANDKLDMLATTAADLTLWRPQELSGTEGSAFTEPIIN